MMNPNDKQLITNKFKEQDEINKWFLLIHLLFLAIGFNLWATIGLIIKIL